jgi:hypothetical protein
MRFTWNFRVVAKIQKWAFALSQRTDHSHWSRHHPLLRRRFKNSLRNRPRRIEAASSPPPPSEPAIITMTANYLRGGLRSTTSVGCKLVGKSVRFCEIQIAKIRTIQDKVGNPGAQLDFRTSRFLQREISTGLSRPRRRRRYAPSQHRLHRIIVGGTAAVVTNHFLLSSWEAHATTTRTHAIPTRD